MAAQIPIKDDPIANEQALAKVREDKQREVHDGHDGTWVAHPGLVEVAKQEFDEVMTTPNQIQRLRNDVNVTAKDLLQAPTGTMTEAGLRLNIRVGVQYLESWLRGQGCVPLYNLMEDAATAEISRTQAWQWLHNAVRWKMADALRRRCFAKCLPKKCSTFKTKLEHAASARGKFSLAASLFQDIIEKRDLEEFLTLRAYSYLD